jgi:gas vesicle protein
MTEKMEEIEDHVRGTAQHTRSSLDETVDRTVENVKSSVGENMERIKDNVDVQQLVDERPWLMFGGSVLAGYMLGGLTSAGSSQQRSHDGRYSYPSHDETVEQSARAAGGDRHYRYYSDDSPRTSEGHSSDSSRIAGVKAESSDFVDDVLDQFREEVDTLKDAAVATMTRILRDTLHDNMPQLAEEFERARAERQQYYAQRSGGAHLDTPHDQNRPTSIVEPTAAESDAVPTSDALKEQQRGSSTSSIVETERA